MVKELRTHRQDSPSQQLEYTEVPEVIHLGISGEYESSKSGVVPQGLSAEECHIANSIYYQKYPPFLELKNYLPCLVCVFLYRLLRHPRNKCAHVHWDAIQVDRYSLESNPGVLSLQSPSSSDS